MNIFKLINKDIVDKCYITSISIDRNYNFTDSLITVLCLYHVYLYADSCQCDIQARDQTQNL